MIFLKLFFTRLIPFDEQQIIIIIMFRSWLMKIFVCIPHIHNSDRRDLEQHPVVKKKRKHPVTASHSLVCHTFSPPLKVSMLRKVHCRRQLQSYDSNVVSLPLVKTSFQQAIAAAAFLNESHNCAEISPCKYMSSSARCIRKPSLIAIDIDDDEFLAKQSLIELVHNNRTPTTSTYRFDPPTTHSRSSPSVHKQTSDSIIFVHRYRPTRNDHHNSRQRTRSSHSPNNTNSNTDDSPSSATNISTSSSMSDVFTPLNQAKDKTWRLKIHDDLNKDGSRHNVMHKGIFTKSI